MPQKLHDNIQPFLKASEEEKKAMLEKAEDLSDFSDPYLRILWHHSNIMRAREGGPHVDHFHQPDPRTVDHLEVHLVNQYGTLYVIL